MHCTITDLVSEGRVIVSDVLCIYVLDIVYSVYSI